MDAAAIGVAAKDGVVTLTGTVSSYAEKLAAAAAHRVPGVHDVANDLVVLLPGRHERTDSEIALAIRHALEWDVLVPDERIQSTVISGMVTLSGSVDTYKQREDAERAVRNLAGVKGLASHIKVGGQHVDPDRLREAVEAALERRAERAARRIRLTVQDGVVTVHGRIRSWAERQAVLGTIGHAPGVRRVIDALEYATPAEVAAQRAHPAGWHNPSQALGAGR